MKLIKLFIAALFLAAGAAHAQQLSLECESYQGVPQVTCYKKAIKALADDAESAHFRMEFLYSSKLSPKEMGQFKTKYRGDVNSIYRDCGVDLHCTFTRWMDNWDIYNNINNEISKRRNLNQPLPLLQAQLQNGVVKKVQGVPFTEYNDQPVQPANAGYQLSETERKLGYTLDDIPEANSEEWEGD